MSNILIENDSSQILLEEVEVLQTIFIEELTIQWKDESRSFPSMISIKIVPSTGDDTEKQYVCLILELTPSVHYPNVHPGISLKNPRGLSEEHLLRIRNLLVERAKEREGGPMIYELVDLVRESLTNENVPYGECTICLDMFTEADNFLKTECYHYFHKHCLGRYIKHCKKEEKNEQSMPLHRMNSQVSAKKSILCPVCREVLEQDYSFLVDYETIESPVFFKAGPELIELQKSFEILLAKQKKKGGIINLEDEKNRYLLQPLQNSENSTVVLKEAVSLTHKDESNCQGSRPSADSNQSCNRPSADSNQSCNRPSADSNQSCNRSSADYNQSCNRPSADSNQYCLLNGVTDDKVKPVSMENTPKPTQNPEPFNKKENMNLAKTSALHTKENSLSDNQDTEIKNKKSIQANNSKSKNIRKYGPNKKQFMNHKNDSHASSPYSYKATKNETVFNHKHPWSVSDDNDLQSSTVINCSNTAKPTRKYGPSKKYFSKQDYDFPASDQHDRFQTSFFSAIENYNLSNDITPENVYSLNIGTRKSKSLPNTNHKNSYSSKHFSSDASVTDSSSSRTYNNEAMTETKPVSRIKHTKKYSVTDSTSSQTYNNEAKPNPHIKNNKKCFPYKPSTRTSNFTQDEQTDSKELVKKQLSSSTKIFTKNSATHEQYTYS